MTPEEQLMAALAKFGQHKGACVKWRATNFGCLCGLHAAQRISLEDDIRGVIKDDKDKVQSLLKHYKKHYPELKKHYPELK